MLGQTVHLFIKALIVGLLVNVGLQQISTVSPLPVQQTILPHQIPLIHSSANNTELHLSDQVDNAAP